MSNFSALEEARFHSVATVVLEKLRADVTKVLERVDVLRVGDTQHDGFVMFFTAISIDAALARALDELVRYNPEMFKNVCKST